MINLAAYYGDTIFKRETAYNTLQIYNWVINVILDLIRAYIVVKVFEIHWDYATLKVWLIIITVGFVKGIIKSPLDWINYCIFMKKAMKSEINHYLRVYNIKLTDDNSSTYDDFTLDAAFSPELDIKLRILAAFNYGGFASVFKTNPRLESMYNRAWMETATEFIEHNEDRVVRSPFS
jgi:hypothetical protein